LEGRKSKKIDEASKNGKREKILKDRAEGGKVRKCMYKGGPGPTRGQHCTKLREAEKSTTACSKLDTIWPRLYVMSIKTPKATVRCCFHADVKSF